MKTICQPFAHDHTSQVPGLLVYNAHPSTICIKLSSCHLIHPSAVIKLLFDCPPDHLCPCAHYCALPSVGPLSIHLSSYRSMAHSASVQICTLLHITLPWATPLTLQVCCSASLMTYSYQTSQAQSCTIHATLFRTHLSAHDCALPFVPPFLASQVSSSSHHVCPIPGPCRSS